MDPILDVQDVVFRYAEETPLLEGVSFSIRKGEILSVLGPNASGKSTLLQILGGLLPPDRGRVLFHGEDLAATPEHRRGPLRRKLAMVFQGAALLGDLTVFENLALRFRYAGTPDRAAVKERVFSALRLVDAAETADRMPHELTFGMQKRVAVARAIVGDPEVVLYDDPSSNLDSIQMFEILGLLKQLQRRGQTAVVVSSDPQLIMRSADRMVLLYDGRIRATGSPVDVMNSGDPYIQRMLSRRLDIGSELG